MRWYTETPFRVGPPRAMVIHPDWDRPSRAERVKRFTRTLDLVERLLDLAVNSPGLSRRARRRRRGERTDIRRQLKRWN